MMSKRAAWLLCGALALALAWTGAVQAADRNGKFAVKGAGVGSCERFLRAKEGKTSEYFLFGGWLDGYISAQNQVRKDTFDLVAWENTDILAGYLEAFCRKNPDTLFYQAVGAMAAALVPQRIEAASKPIEMDHEGRRLSIYRETLRRVQQRLQQEGLYQGAIDGLYGPGTRKALLGFQQRKGIAETGVPDHLTLYRMLIRPIGQGEGAGAE